MRLLSIPLALLAGMILYAWIQPVSVNVIPPVAAGTIDDVIIEANAKAPQRFPDRPKHSADVKVVTDNGHGSGVHIGGGFFLTAGHVAVNAATSKRFDIQLDDKSIRKAEVLWINTERDVALMKADGTDIEPSRLACIVPVVGQSITLTGNPMMLDRITVYGRVAGDERELGKWKSVVIVDAPSIPGQSGGAVYNELHEVVGITIGLVMLPMGLSSSVTGYGTVVPGKTICQLLARAA